MDNKINIENLEETQKIIIESNILIQPATSVENTSKNENNVEQVGRSNGIAENDIKLGEVSMECEHIEVQHEPNKECVPNVETIERSNTEQNSSDILNTDGTPSMDTNELNETAQIAVEPLNNMGTDTAVPNELNNAEKSSVDTSNIEINNAEQNSLETLLNNDAQVSNENNMEVVNTTKNLILESTSELDTSNIETNGKF